MIDTTPYDNFDDFFTWYLKIVESKVPNYLALDSDLIHNKFGALTQQEFEFTCKKIREIYPLPKRIKLVNDNSLGTFYSVQFFNKLKSEEPELLNNINAENLIEIKKWLNKNIHRLGSYLNAEEICEKVTGGRLDVQNFIDYIS